MPPARGSLRSTLASAGSALLLPVLGPACSDFGVTLGEPTIELSAQALDFGEVVVGRQETLSLVVQNTGDGPLSIQTAALDGTSSPDFSLVELGATQVGKGQQAELLLVYSPGAIGQDYGRLQLSTNDPESPILTVDLAGYGVEPEIVLDPDLLWFGNVTPGESSSLSVTVSSQGSGALEISEVALTGGTEGTFGFLLPGSVTLPYAMPSGTSMDVVVTFSPETTDPVSGDLVFVTNDPGALQARVELLGNTSEDPTKTTPPSVSILLPSWGQYVMSDQEVQVVGEVHDEEDGPEDLVCLAYAGDTPLGTAVPNADGRVTMPAALFPEGEQVVLLRCLDSDGATGEDSVDVIVWTYEEPIEYVLAPGETPFAWWFVDDDVKVYLDGELVFDDDNHHTDSHPPLTIEAELGQEIRVEVTDYNHCDAVIDPLNLHFGTTERQEGIEGICWSACPSHACYSPDYTGPWPSVVYEASFIVSIP